MAKVNSKMDFSTPEPKPEVMRPLTQDVLEKNKQDLMSFFNVSNKTKAAVAVSGLGILLFFVSLSTVSFQNVFFDKLYPKQPSQASQTTDIPVHAEITGNGFMLNAAVSQKVDVPFNLEVKVKTATETASVMMAQLKYDPEFFEIVSTDDQNSVVTSWIDKNTNTSGTISLVASFAKGRKVEDADKYISLQLKPKKEGRTSISVDPQNSKIYRFSDKKEIPLEFDTLPLVISK